LLPKHRENITIDNQTLLNTLIYRCKNGGKWRSLPETFGNGQMISVRLNCRAEKSVLERFFAKLAGERLPVSGVCRWNTKLHAVPVWGMVAFKRSRGNVPDAVEGRLLLETIGKQEYTVNRLMDRAYEAERTGLRAGELGFNPVVPVKRNRVHPWGMTGNYINE
jgi:transposase